MANYSNLTFNSDYLSKSLTLDGISFNHVIHTDTHHTQILGRGTWGTTNTSGTLIDDNYAVNAVDINWNGAKPDIGETSDGITTTGELLTLIKKYAGTTVKNSLIGTSTDASIADTIWGAKNYADEVQSASYNQAKIEANTLLGHDGDLWPDRKTVYGVAKYADTTVKNSLIGSPDEDSTHDTIYGAKVYADEKDTFLEKKLIGKSTDTTIDTHWGVKNSLLGATGDRWPNQQTLYGVAKYAETVASSSYDNAVAEASRVLGKEGDQWSTQKTVYGVANYAFALQSASYNKAEIEASSVLGKEGDQWSTQKTVYGVAKYTDTKIAELQTRVEALEAAFSTLAQNVGSLVTITNGDQT